MTSFSCKDCKKRYSGCHSKCDTYKKELAEYEKKKALMETEREYYKYARASVAIHMDMMAKKRKKQIGYEGLSGRR